MKLPPEQQRIRDRCIHRFGTFVQFPMEDVETSIPARFEKIVRLYPDRTAVKTRIREVTYKELNRRANRLARELLVRRGPAPEPIALLLDDWDTLVLGHLAVLKAGKFSVALDPMAETGRSAHIMNDSDPRVIIVNECTAMAARALTANECSILKLDALPANLSEENPGNPIPPEATSYIRYTSGSTGSAKGAIKTHRHVLRDVMDFINEFHLCPDDRITILDFGSIGKHLLEALLAGACFCPFDARKEGLIHLCEWLQGAQTSVYYSFPTALRYFLNSLAESEVLADLRLIELEGEPVYRNDVELIQGHVSSDCILVNTFSSAETGTATMCFVDLKSEVSDERVPVGYPVEGVEALILDDAGKALAFDQVGEVAVLGSCLSDGYWRRPEVTRERFIAQSDGESRRLYRTGDLGRLSPDGCLHLLGRKDFQVKIRSFRVDVTEVEAVLARHAAIQSVVVVGNNDRAGNTKLVAYVVERTPAAAKLSTLKAFLRDKLPEYMIPAEIVFVDEIPLMSTGKVNRRALAEQGIQGHQSARLTEAPRTSIEKTLAQIWAEVLSLPSVGVRDNFFDLGGHSLAASLIISRVIQTFKLELSIKALFDAPTVAEMANVVTEKQERRASEAKLAQLLRDVEAMTDDEKTLLMKAMDSASAKR